MSQMMSWRQPGWLCSLVAVVVCAGCNREQPKPVQAKPPEVMVALPTEEIVTEFEEFTGRTMAIDTIEIRARVSGYLDKVLFKDGVDLEAQAPLFEIDPRTYQAEANRARAAVAQATARLEQLTRREARASKLMATRAISQEEFELVTFERAEAKAALDAVQAQQELADLNLSFTKMAAPLSGRISRRLVDPGNLIKADETVLATIVSLDPIYAYFDVDERTVLRLRRLIQEGKLKSARSSIVMVQMALADEKEFAFEGAINFVDNQIDPHTGTLRLRAVIENPKHLLSPGMFVRLRVPIGAPRQALLVREESLGTDQGQRFVYVVNEKDEVSYRRVKVGLLTGGRRVIENGLLPTERVIVIGLQRVRPGVKVAPKMMEPEPAEVARKQAPTRELGAALP